jgi:hypothetical protein
MKSLPILALLLGIATNAGAVAFAEVRITHVTTGNYLLSDPADQTITSSVEMDEVLASVAAGRLALPGWRRRLIEGARPRKAACTPG